VDETMVPLLEASIAAAAHEAAVERVVVVGSNPGDVGGVAAMSFPDLAVEGSGGVVEVLVEDRDVAQCLYTSGTTSRPKAVLTSHVAVMMAALSTCVQFRHERGDGRSVFPIVLPLYHVTALNCLTLPVLVTGGTVVLHRGFDADALLHDIATRNVTHMMLLPMMWGAFVTHADGPAPGGDSVRMAIYAMAPMNAERLDDIRRVLPHADVVLGSGQTEFTPPTVMQWPSHQWERSGSWGAAVSTADVQIMAPDGTLLGPGQEGEIVYRGPQSMQGYGNRPGANAEVFAHGWFHSGDVGYLDPDGVLWFTDRVKDIVKTGGENVSSVEVERVLLGHPDVADCAVVGLSDPRWGEAVTAVVVAAEGHSPTEEALRAHAKEHLAGYKVPKRIVLLSELPRTSTGKIRKQEIREQLDAPQ
jgi:acyl-CoA synthetase (AMP-forming)/AMP-acid ligase II